MPGTINTFEFDLCGNKPTCRVVVDGVVPNGAIDGLAFGFYWKDGQGYYHVLKSSGGPDTAQSNFIGAWPRAYSDSSWASATPQLGTCGNCRHQARMTLYGAQLLLDGSYNLCCRQFHAVRIFRP